MGYTGDGVSYTGDGVSGLLVAEPSIRLGSSPWPYAETAAAAVSTLATVHDWTKSEAMLRLSGGRVRFSTDFRLPQLTVAEDGAAEELGPLPLLTLWADSSHWFEVGLTGKDVDGAYFWNLHVNSDLTDTDGEDLGVIASMPAAGRTLRLLVHLEAAGTARLRIIDVVARTTLVTYDGTLASWRGLTVAKVRLGCDHSGAGQRHLIIERIEVF